MRTFPEAFKVGNSFIYGRDDDMKRIIKLLSLEDDRDLNSTVISIVADRGTGRTTLLHLLHSELCTAYDTRNFLCMPERFDEKGLIRVIIESLTGIPCDITDLDVLKETIKDELMDQRLLLLLDNFENKSQKCWDLLLSLLQVCKGKSAVVVTSTRETVAKVKEPIQFYYMNNLSKEWCWMIFKQDVLFDQTPDAHAELADIGKHLLVKCRNVTLCVKVLCGVLRNSFAADRWRVILDNIYWEMNDGDGEILPALRVCYEYLSSHLKPCFKYCSLFPKEYIFSRQHLVHMWLSQGFIEPSEGRELEDIGLEYFDQLVAQSFLQPSLIHDMEDKFVMPGLIHDLAQHLSKNVCFQFDGYVQKAPANSCHMSLVPYEGQRVPINHLISEPRNLKTLLITSRSAFQHHITSSYILKPLGLEDVSVNFCNLLTLNLNSSDIEELPESFGTLINLRYLGLSSTKIKRIPLEISNLIHLQLLEAKECPYLEELPATIDQLTNLRYLDVTKEAGFVVMPYGIGKLTNLRSLATFNVGNGVEHCRIEELKSLVFLRGRLEITGIMNVQSGFNAKEVDMRSKQHIETLSLLWSDSDQACLDREGVKTAEEVLEIFCPTYYIRELVIRHYPGNDFPKWIERSSFSMLASLIFDNCYNCEMLPYLGGLPSLKFLSIQQMHSVTRMELSNSKEVPVNTVRFPSLEMLTIWEMYKLEHWVELEDQNFPQLRSLSINKCAALRNIPQFSSLVDLSINNCTQLPECTGHTSLNSLKIGGLQKAKLIKLPNTLTGLKILDISHCPEILSIEGLSHLTLIETIKVTGCPKLDIGNDKHLYNQKERIYTR
jgi:NB-ARC domain